MWKNYWTLTRSMRGKTLKVFGLKIYSYLNKKREKKIIHTLKVVVLKEGIWTRVQKYLSLLCYNEGVKKLKIRQSWIMTKDRISPSQHNQYLDSHSHCFVYLMLWFCDLYTLLRDTDRYLYAHTLWNHYKISGCALRTTTLIF